MSTVTSSLSISENCAKDNWLYIWVSVSRKFLCLSCNHQISVVHTNPNLGIQMATLFFTVLLNLWQSCWKETLKCYLNLKGLCTQWPVSLTDFYFPLMVWFSSHKSRISSDSYCLILTHFIFLKLHFLYSDHMHIPTIHVAASCTFIIIYSTLVIICLSHLFPAGINSRR